MKRTDWVTRLVRRRLHSAAPLPLEERAAVAQAWRELNRIGINLNQATRALNASVMVESGIDVAREAARVASFRTEIRIAIAGLEIGSASCRERVCPYVVMYEVDERVK